VPVDGNLDSNVNWISTIAVTDMLSAIPTRHVLVVADSCYSGAGSWSGDLDVVGLEAALEVWKFMSCTPGLMLWFTRKRFIGSYVFLRATRRSYFLAP